MKAIVSSKDLLKSIEIVSSVISKNLAMPIIGFVKMEFKNKRLILTGTNLKTTVIHKMSCEMKNDFSIVMLPSKVRDLCHELPENNSHITIEEKSDCIMFFHDKGKSKFPKNTDGDIFPNTENADYYMSIDVDGDVFYSITKAFPCGSKVPELTHLHNCAVDFQKSQLTVVGISQFIGYVKDFPIKCKKDVLIQLSPEMVSLCKTFQESTMSVSDTLFKVEHRDTTVIQQLYSNTYVPYNMVRPKPDVQYNISIDRQDLKTCLSIISVSNNKTSNQVVFTYDGSKMKLFGTDLMKEEEADIELSYIDADPGFEMEPTVLNVVQLKTLIDTMDCEKLKFSFTRPNKTIFIKPDIDEEISLFIQPIVSLV